MPQCLNCRAENTPDARFCAECGVRLEQPPLAPQDQPTVPGQAPRALTGKETVMLHAPDLVPPEPRPDRPPPAAPFTDATIISGPPVSAAPPATDKTILAGPPAAGSVGAPSGGPTSAPTSAFPVQPTSQIPTTPILPSGAIPPRGSGAQSGGRLWLVIGLVVLLGLGMIGALVAGVLIFTRTTSSTVGTPTVEAGGGLARLPTARPRSTTPPKPTAKPKPTAAPSPSAEPSSQDKVLLEDNFDDPKSSQMTEETTENAVYSFVDGAYAINVKTPKYIVWSSYDGSHADVDVTVDVVFDSGPLESAAGVLFRYQDEDNFYYYRLSADGSYSLALYKAGERQMLVDWTDAPEIKGRGKTNHMRVEALGDTIRLFIDDTFLAEVSDDTFTKGEIALGVTTFDQGGATFKFDNLIVQGRS